jgi:hypothetical protein
MAIKINKSNYNSESVNRTEDFEAVCGSGDGSLHRYLLIIIRGITNMHDIIEVRYSTVFRRLIAISLVIFINLRFNYKTSGAN